VPLLVTALSEGVLVDRSISEQHVWLGFCLAVSFFGLAIRCATVGFVPARTSGRATRAQKVDALNTSGLYSLVRNPLYLGNFVIIFGIAMSPMVWWLVVVVVLTYWLYIERITAAEEAYLAQKFGAEYAGWAERTPAFLPRFGNWRPPELPFSTRTVLRREYNGFFAIVAVYFAIELASSLAFRGDSLSNWLSEHGEWLAFFLLGGAVFLGLRALKKRTRLLHVEGR
jgi:protein-S-isoprenylcysteine O-methyltransferase Ste14